MEHETDTELSLTELADRADVTPRTVRYYIAQGLLPAPGQGPNTRYSQSHLDRLRLIKRLQQEHLPLAEIRGRLAALEDREVADLVAAAEPEQVTPSSALDYIRGVLNKPAGGTSPPPAAPMAREPATRGFFAIAAAPAPKPASAPPPPDVSTWERIAITPDVEIHVRRPLDRQTNKLLDQLLSHARALFRRDIPEGG